MYTQLLTTVAREASVGLLDHQEYGMNLMQPSHEVCGVVSIGMGDDQGRGETGPDDAVMTPIVIVVEWRGGSSRGYQLSASCL